MTAATSSSGRVRRTAEVLEALSAGLDAAERRTEGHAIRTAYLACRLADELCLADDTKSDLLFAGLLLDGGSTGLLPSDHEPAQASRRTRSGRGSRNQARAAQSRHLSRPDRAVAVVSALGFGPGVADAVVSADERWDGRGPRHIRKTAIPEPGRILAVASAAAAVGPAAQPAAIDKALKTRRGHELDPDLVAVAIGSGKLGLWSELESPELPRKLLDLEPLAAIKVSDEASLDRIAGAFADIVDTRTPRMGRHGRRVATYAERTGAELGLDTTLLAGVRRAALLHDIGKLLVPIAYLEKPAELTEAERRVVEEHAQTGAAILLRSRALASLGPLVVAHHQRLDGYGMFPVTENEAAAVAARVIAVCDRYEAMTAERPYRPMLSTEQVWRILDEVVSEPIARVALRALRRAVGET
jgi:putative nucleotidyltransferase with HDIG domain